MQVYVVGANPGLRVLEQNYPYDLLSPAKLLEKYVGRTVRVLRWSETKGRDEERDAVVLSAGEPPILRVGDEITWAFPGRIAFPEIPRTLIARPTLVWLVDSPSERQKVEVDVVEPASGDWGNVSSSQKATKEDARTFSFRVPVPARGSTRVEYRVRVRWC